MRATAKIGAAVMAGLLAALSCTASADDGHPACKQDLAARALTQGIDTGAFQRWMGPVRGDRSVLALLDHQPEFSTPIWDYLAGLVDAERIADGRQHMKAHAALLARIGQQYGVDPAVVVAVWGVETDYGRVTGKRHLLDSLLTLSCEGRRQAFFRGELMALLRLAEAGDVEPHGVTGSWAGAFGHTQFMPSTYARIAVDGDGDGRRDLVGSIPDALSSTANYLKRSGWRPGQPWGIEVTLPVGFDTRLAGRTKRQPLSAWRALGVRAIGGSALSATGIADQDPSALLLPAGPKGPAWLVFRNFDAIHAYNAAESYALAIALLADGLQGRAGRLAAWPTDDPGLDRAQRRQLQQRLIALGHDIGTVDGLVGTATRRAIAAEQRRLGWKNPDGRPSVRILQQLQAPLPHTSLPASTRFVLPGNALAWQQSPHIRSSIDMTSVPGLKVGRHQGLDAWLVETGQATAAISMVGGQLLSWAPAGQSDVLWLSDSLQPLPTPIRGGTPVCWPYFGRQGQSGDVPSHGFVRTLPWTLRHAEQLEDGSIRLELQPSPLDGLTLDLHMELTIGQQLEQRLVTRNRGNEPAHITQALHNYFRVSDVRSVRVDGVEGLQYQDKYTGGERFSHAGPWQLDDPRDPGRSDRIYEDAGGRYRIHDSGLGRTVEVLTQGSRSVVIWNPGEEGGRGMPDVGGQWSQYLCVESANAGRDVVSIPAGGEHVLEQRFRLL